MKKLLGLFIVVSLFFISSTTYAQLIDEKNVTVTMDLQPILQLNMTTPDQVEFIFDDIKSYYSGIIKYGATVLKVSSSVSWDLYAVGTSVAGTTWDQQQSYSAGTGLSSSVLPLSLLELHQYESNDFKPAGVRDYSATFQAANTAVPVFGQNSIYNSATPYTPPLATDKYIQGHKGTGVLLSAPGGSYLTTTAVLGTFSNFYFTIDYRILPGLPATFKMAGTSALASQALDFVVPGTYAEPGVYTMNVKYILLEDQ